MKKIFEEPVIEVQAFNAEDIITTSSSSDDDLGDGGLPVAP